MSGAAGGVDPAPARQGPGGPPPQDRLGQARTSFGHLMSVDEEVWNGGRLTFRCARSARRERHD